MTYLIEANKLKKLNLKNNRNKNHMCLPDGDGPLERIIGKNIELWLGCDYYNGKITLDAYYTYYDTDKFVEEIITYRKFFGTGLANKEPAVNELDHLTDDMISIDTKEEFSNVCKRYNLEASEDNPIGFESLLIGVNMNKRIRINGKALRSSRTSS